MVAYSFTGMNDFDAIVHAMTTVSTGGMANYDVSFATFGAGVHYVAVVFMILAALPFVRFQGAGVTVSMKVGVDAVFLCGMQDC